VDNTGEQLIGDGHYASDQIRERLDELHKLWAYLFERSNDKGKSDLKINVLLANILKLEIAWSSLGQVTDDKKGRKTGIARSRHCHIGDSWLITGAHFCLHCRC